MKGRLTLARLMVVLTAVTSSASMARGQDAPPGAFRPDPAPKRPAARNRDAKTLLSEQDCREYAQMVVKAVKSGDRAALNALIDWESIWKTATAGFELSGAVSTELFNELSKQALGDSSVAAQLIRNSQAGGDFGILRIRRNHERQVILCRMIQPISVGGVGYFEFVPTRFPDGKIRAVDVYIMSTAEFFSAALRRAVLPSIANRAQSIVDRLLKNEQDYIRDLPKLTGILDLMNQGRMKEALAEFGELRPETKKEKTVLMIRLRAAQPVDQKQYAAVLEEFRTLYPQDPCFDLLSIDYYTLKKDFVRALESVDRLDKSLGGDPYLNVIRASLSEPRGDLAEARRFARLAIDQEPRLLSAYLELLGISLLDKKNDQTLAMLKEIDLTFHLQLRDLKTVPAYAGFVRSPHYKQWMQYLERRDKDRTRKHDQSPARGATKSPGTVKPGSRG